MALFTSRTRTIFLCNICVFVCLARFSKKLSPNAPFASNSFFRPKNYFQSSHYKNWGCNRCFFFFSSFPSPRSFSLLLSFSFVAVILELWNCCPLLLNFMLARIMLISQGTSARTVYNFTYFINFFAVALQIARPSSRYRTF